MAVLIPEDLEGLIGVAEVARLSNRDGGTLRNTDAVEQIIVRAEDFAYSRLAAGWPSRTAVDLLLTHDKFLRDEVAWIACEFLSESKTEFLNADGSGRFMTQYKRAVETLDKLAKGQQRSAAENRAGVSSNIGGAVQPAKEPPTFVFAVSKNNPNGSGGY